MRKMTENEVIDVMISYLHKYDWKIKSHCKNMEKGYDIVAIKGDEIMIIEAKGARPHYSDDRPDFNNSQVRTHFGKALVQTIEAMSRNAGTRYAIAHPDDPFIRKTIGNLVPYLKEMNILHYWVKSDGTVTEC